MAQWANSYKINHLLCNLREHENHQYEVWKKGQIDLVNLQTT